MYKLEKSTLLLFTNKLKTQTKNLLFHKLFYYDTTLSLAQYFYSSKMLTCNNDLTGFHFTWVSN